jgi:putative inorganic carbon (HCO3(-)) transporter
MTHRNQPRLNIPKRTRVLLGAWIVSWIVSTVFSNDLQASLGALKAWLVDPLIVLAALTLVTRKKSGISWLIRGAATSGSIVAVAGVVQLFAYQSTLQDGRLSSFFAPVANYAAMFLGPISILTIGSVLWRLLSRWWLMAAVVMLVALALTVSFGGYVAVGAGLLVLLATWPNKKMRNIAAAALIILAIIGGVIVSQTRFFTEKLNTTDRSSSLVRTQIWHTSIEMIKERPIVGVGPNAFEAVYRETIPRLYFPPLEWLVAQPHQLLLALWLETGLLGLLVFLVSMVLWFRAVAKKAKQQHAASVLGLAAMTAILIHGLVDTPLFKNDLMIIFFLVLAIPFLHTKSEETKN